MVELTPLQRQAQLRQVGFEDEFINDNANAFLRGNPDALQELLALRAAPQQQSFDDVGSFDGVVPPQQLPGVRPIGVLEPLNQIQRSTLQRIAGGPESIGGIGQAQQAFTQGMGALQGVGQFDPSQDINAFLNPFLGSVIEQNQQDITRQRERLQPGINQRATQVGGFGGARQGIREGLADEAAINAAAQQSAQLRAGGFQNAAGNALSAFGQQSSNAFNQAQGFQNIGGGFANLDALNQGLFFDRQQQALGAGGQIQGQNQLMLDAIQRERELQIQDPQQRIGNFQQTIGSFPLGQTVSTPGVGAAQGALGGGLAGLGVAQSFGFGGGGNNLRQGVNDAFNGSSPLAISSNNFFSNPNALQGAM